MWKQLEPLHHAATNERDSTHLFSSWSEPDVLKNPSILIGFMADDQPLSLLSPGESAHVVGIEPGHPLRRRLMELGLVRGARVTVLRRAPLGDPLELQVGHSLLALRATDLAAITVRPS